MKSYNHLQYFLKYQLQFLNLKLT